MSRERYVIKTNQNRYVSIPFILNSGFRSYLDETPVWNKTKSFDTSNEAENYLEKLLSPTDKHYVDTYSLKPEEELDSIVKVQL